MRVRGLLFRDADDAHDYFAQRELDDAMFPDVTFEEENHEYRLDGAVIPSVTAIIAPVYREAGGSQAVREYKRQIGKALDRSIQLAEKNDLDYSTVDPAVLPFFEAWLKFKRESGFRVLLNQPVVFSRKLRFAGTPDLIGTRTFGTMTPDELLDTKCVWTLDPATAIQTAGYAIGAEESLGIKVKRRGAIQLLKNGAYKFEPYNNALDMSVFRCCLTIYSWRKLHGG